VNIRIEDFGNLCDLIYRKSGMHYETNQMYFVARRVEKRCTEIGIENVSEYIRYLRFMDTGNVEFQNLVELLTVNESYFFRDFPQLLAFAEHSLQEVSARKAAIRDRNIKIWSAGCSTGDEPYTLAIILREMLEDLDTWSLQVLASDIDREVLKYAINGVYDERHLRDVPKDYLKRHFIEVSKETYRVSQELKKLVKFNQVNLSDKDEVRQHKGFDFIFSRNVLIYFDDALRKRLVDYYYMALNPGGYLFLGSSESIARISTAFKIKKMGGYLVYYKD
jgi:chemotaxis protein methyltransferase CheR